MSHNRPTYTQVLLRERYRVTSHFDLGDPVSAETGKVWENRDGFIFLDAGLRGHVCASCPGPLPNPSSLDQKETNP